MTAVPYDQQWLRDTFEHAPGYLIDITIDRARLVAPLNNDAARAPAYDPALANFKKEASIDSRTRPRVPSRAHTARIEERRWRISPPA